jgi:hypothetical protein
MEVPLLSDRGAGDLQIRTAVSSGCPMLSYKVPLPHFFGDFFYLESCAHLFRVNISVLCGDHSVIIAFFLFDLKFDNETAAVHWIFNSNEKTKMTEMSN